MTHTVHLQPAFLPALTLQPWHMAILGQLEQPRRYTRALVGVDVGNVDLPSKVVSEVSMGFVFRDDRIVPNCLSLNEREREKYRYIQETVADGGAGSRMTHWALDDRSAQINTAIFRAFTLAYSYDLQRPRRDLAALNPRLIMHQGTTCRNAEMLSSSIQACLDGLSSGHDDLRHFKLRAPSAGELELLFRTLAA